MIKISRNELEGGRIVELKIEGKIVSAWAQELKQYCAQVLKGPVELLVLDFSSVTSIDREGIQLLKKVDCSRIKIVGCNMFFKDLIEGTKLKQCVVDSETSGEKE